MSTRKRHVILGLSYSYDSGAALLVDGELVAAVNEERINRIKSYAGFPALSIKECLRIACVRPDEVDQVAIGGRMNFPYESGIERPSPIYRFVTQLSRVGFLRALLGNRPTAYLLRGMFGQSWNPIFNRHSELTDGLRALGIPTERIRYVDHHHCHNASAYYASGFDDCYALSIDAFGDCFSSRLYRCVDGRMHLMRSVAAYHSPAHHYAYVTALLGFKPTRHEGKITGLAAFGRPDETAKILGRRITYSTFWKTPIVRGYYQKAEVDYLSRALKGHSKEDIAAGVQHVLEDVVSRFIRDNIPDIQNSRVVLSGGVMANVRLNQVIAELGFRDVFVFPHMSDGGLAVGACYVANVAAGGANHPIRNVYLGAYFSDGEIETALSGSGFDWHRSDAVEGELAEQIAKGQIIARFNGRMEYGPRALCHRSIFYRADDPSVNTWLNQKLRRTEFMPFAPVLLREDAPRFLVNYDADRSIAANYMTITYAVTDLCKEKAPAIVHVDGTARPQLVDQAIDPSMFRLLTEYKRRRGHSVMVNTSLNMHEEPIVHTPAEAVESVRQAGLDVLAIGNYIAFNRERTVSEAQSDQKKRLHRVDSHRRAPVREIGGTIRLATVADIPALARIHATSLPDDFLPSLGMRFLERAYYPATFASSCGVHYVVTRNDEDVVGFVTVAHDTVGFSHDVMRTKAVRIVADVLRAATRRPSSLTLSAEVALSVLLAKPDFVNGEIVVIAVDPAAQKGGLGKVLVQSSLDYLRERGQDRCRTKTLASNAHVIRMYEKMGWFIRDRFRLIGRNYVTLVSPPLRDDRLGRSDAVFPPIPNMPANG